MPLKDLYSGVLWLLDGCPYETMDLLAQHLQDPSPSIQAIAIVGLWKYLTWIELSILEIPEIPKLVAPLCWLLESDLPEYLLNEVLWIIINLTYESQEPILFELIKQGCLDQLIEIFKSEKSICTLSSCLRCISHFITENDLWKSVLNQTDVLPLAIELFSYVPSGTK